MYIHDATEQAFKNGVEFMREQVIQELRSMRGRAMGQERIILGDIIEKVQKLEGLRHPGPPNVWENKTESGLLEED